MNPDDNRAIRVRRTGIRRAQAARGSMHGVRTMITRSMTSSRVTTRLLTSNIGARRMITGSSTSGREIRSTIRPTAIGTGARRMTTNQNDDDGSRERAAYARRMLTLFEFYAQFPNPYENFTMSLSEEQIQQIPTLQISKEHLDEELNCCVCFEHYNIKEEVLQLKCGHMYHNNCILPWLRMNRTCPICRAVLAEPPSINQHELMRNLRDHERRIMQRAAELRAAMDTDSE